MSTIYDLPNDIIDIITTELLSYRDMAILSMVGKLFNKTINSLTDFRIVSLTSAMFLLMKRGSVRKMNFKFSIRSNNRLVIEFCRFTRTVFAEKWGYYKVYTMDDSIRYTTELIVPNSKYIKMFCSHTYVTSNDRLTEFKRLELMGAEIFNK